MNLVPQNATVTDREISLKRLGGDEKLLATLAGFFLEDAPGLMQQLNDAHHSNDWKIVAHRAHSLKGLSATFEAIPFREMAGEIEGYANSADRFHVDEKMPLLRVEFERLVEALQSIAHPVH